MTIRVVLADDQAVVRVGFRAMLELSPADAGAWTSIDVDTSDPYGTSWDTTGEADGLYDLRVVVTDNAGNSATDTALGQMRTLNGQVVGLSGLLHLPDVRLEVARRLRRLAHRKRAHDNGTWSWNTY